MAVKNLVSGSDFVNRLSSSILSFCTCSDTTAQKSAFAIINKVFSCQNIKTFNFLWEQAIIAAFQVKLSRNFCIKLL